MLRDGFEPPYSGSQDLKGEPDPIQHGTQLIYPSNGKERRNHCRAERRTPAKHSAQSRKAYSRHHAGVANSLHTLYQKQRYEVNKLNYTLPLFQNGLFIGSILLIPLYNSSASCARLSGASSCGTLPSCVNIVTCSMNALYSFDWCFSSRK